MENNKNDRLAAPPEDATEDEIAAFEERRRTALKDGRKEGIESLQQMIKWRTTQQSQ